MKKFTWIILITLLMTNISGCSRENKEQKSTNYKYTLIIGKLRIKSSYAQNIELKSDDRYDTVQFWITPNGIWRIKTFAIDDDIHIISMQANSENPIEFAKGHINRIYGDVLDEIITVESDTDDVEMFTKKLQDKKLNPKIEKSKEGFVFWNPDNANYKTKTKPEGF